MDCELESISEILAPGVLDYSRRKAGAAHLVNNCSIIKCNRKLKTQAGQNLEVQVSLLQILVGTGRARKYRKDYFYCFSIKGVSRKQEHLDVNYAKTISKAFQSREIVGNKIYRYVRKKFIFQQKVVLTSHEQYI